MANVIRRVVIEELYDNYNYDIRRIQLANAIEF